MIANYDKYLLKTKETILFLFVNATVVVLVSLLFYNSLLPAIIGSPFCFFALRFESNYLCRRRKRMLITQFKDSLNSLAVTLSTGYSLENSIKEAYIEMSKLYGSSSLICNEYAHLIRQISLGVNVEDAFHDFAVRSNEHNILNFSEILYIAKRNSGNITQIVNEAALKIHDKIELDRELHTIMCAKNYEKNIMCAMPPAIIIYVNLLSPGFLTPMYTTILGRIIMSICLLLYIFTIWFSSRITNIGGD